jgi:prepilin-type N-terminal cleavage/methylation domain-containing protein
MAGFTMIELLISLVIMAVLMLIAVGPLQTFIRRGKIEGITRETATLMQRARFEAIKHSVPARVVADETKHQVFAYADLNNNAQFDAGVDRELARFTLPRGVAFRAHGGVDDDDEATWNMLGTDPAKYAEFKLDGSVTLAGAEDQLPALRFADQRDNFMEVNVATAATARIEVRKWDDGAPADKWGNKYVVQGQNGRAWEWN